jgi:hypothetical protein
MPRPDAAHAHHFACEVDELEAVEQDASVADQAATLAVQQTAHLCCEL